MKVLVADDNPVIQQLLKKVVEKTGHTPVITDDGAKAWELISSEKDFSMVITDWMMPEMDGIQLCKKIREADLPGYVYIILLTARETTEDSLAAFEAGADDYIKKPFNIAELKSRVRAGERILSLEDEQKKAGVQLMQTEKMASIGQLAAGVAHEINNPTGFVSSNLTTLSDYFNDITGLIREYHALAEVLAEAGTGEKIPSLIKSRLEQVIKIEEEIDIEFLSEDIVDLIGDCREGTERIKKIVHDLKDFAHPGEDKLVSADINDGIESTLNVVWNELKYKAEVKKEYGDIPIIKCYPQQLNQVFMNILVNAAHAIEDKGEIMISTKSDNGFVEIIISDTGSGIAPDNLTKIFDPFFTTKEVGKGTGLGMNVAYNIVKKHGGTIDVQSTLGKGTSFIIRIPE